MDALARKPVQPAIARTLGPAISPEPILERIVSSLSSRSEEMAGLRSKLLPLLEQARKGEVADAIESTRILVVRESMRGLVSCSPFSSSQKHRERQLKLAERFFRSQPGEVSLLTLAAIMHENSGFRQQALYELQSYRFAMKMFAELGMNKKDPVRLLAKKMVAKEGYLEWKNGSLEFVSTNTKPESLTRT